MRLPDDESRLVDMLMAAREAREICEGKSRDDFLESRVLQLAVQKLLEIIGEAAVHLTPGAMTRLPRLPWQDIVGMRHRLVHDYPHVSLDKVWSVVQEDLEPLIAAIEPHVPPDPNASRG